MAQKPVKEREFLIWPSAVAVGLVLAFVLLLALPNGFFYGVFIGGPVAALIVLPTVPIALGVAIQCAAQRRYLRAVSALVFPALALVVALNIRPVVRSCAVAAEYVQFYVGYPLFRYAVARVPAVKPRFVVFTMGGFISMSNGIVFDESDEIAKPTGEQSAAWQARAARTFLSADRWSAQRIQGHWYRFSSF